MWFSRSNNMTWLLMPTPHFNKCSSLRPRANIPPEALFLLTVVASALLPSNSEMKERVA